MIQNGNSKTNFVVTQTRLGELLDTEFEFNDRPTPVPADIRAEWRVPLLLLIVKSCWGGRAPLHQVQALAWAAIFEENRPDFIRAYRGESDPAALLIRYDPAVIRAINLAVGLGLLSWHSRNRLTLTGEGETTLDRVLTNDGVLADERAFLADFGGRIPMNRINQMLGIGKL